MRRQTLVAISKSSERARAGPNWVAFCEAAYLFGEARHVNHSLQH